APTGRPERGAGPYTLRPDEVHLQAVRDRRRAPVGPGRQEDLRGDLGHLRPGGAAQADDARDHVAPRPGRRGRPGGDVPRDAGGGRPLRRQGLRLPHGLLAGRAPAGPVAGVQARPL
ncbi:MAG: hypothetical protein AVDCRST_MAG79-3193, partial [uncultured Thermoleophilia bacterium]